SSPRLRHHGRPGLQAQKKERTVKAPASAIDTGTVFSSATPILWKTAMNSSNITQNDLTWPPDREPAFGYRARGLRCGERATPAFRHSAPRSRRDHPPRCRSETDAPVARYRCRPSLARVGTPTTVANNEDHFCCI